jgi:hypothetical protein
MASSKPEHRALQAAITKVAEPVDPLDALDELALRRGTAADGLDPPRGSGPGACSSSPLDDALDDLSAAQPEGEQREGGRPPGKRASGGHHDDRDGYQQLERGEQSHGGDRTRSHHAVRARTGTDPSSAPHTAACGRAAGADARVVSTTVGAAGERPQLSRGALERRNPL